jgi:beta-N-acetylhexosaminidase
MIGQRLMLAFEGFEPPPHVLKWIRERGTAGFTLFRPKNVANPGQVLALNETLQAAAAESGQPLLLIATDQEGGQFVALGDETTHFPSNMALGATGDPELARQVGYATGLELAAMGLNVNYAPDSDVNTNPDNPNVGIRAFGDDPALVAQMAAAMVDGQQAAGVAATAKHFPGSGESSLDPHYGVPVLNHDRERLEAVEFRPFRAAIEAGAKLIMTAHVGLPALTGRADLPATLSAEIMDGLLRQRLGFEGLLITDALDMKAITQGAGQIVDVIAALRAGVDLLLLTGDPEVRERIYGGTQLAISRGLLRPEHLAATGKRLAALRHWLSQADRPPLDVVGCAEHRQLAQKVARLSTTLVKNEAGLLPLNLPAEARIAAIMPRPADLTPADTSKYVAPALAGSIRAYHPNVDEFVVWQQPAESEIRALCEVAADYDLLIIGTISAHLQLEQATLVNELLATGVPSVTVAMRTPYDLSVYPEAKTHVCTYGLEPGALEALAAALFGAIPFQGQLPVAMPGLIETR